MKAHSAVLLIFALAGTLSAQSTGKPLHLDESSVRQQLVESDAPIYPAIAQATRIQGDVTVAVTIDGHGSVASETAVSGPPMLRQAAIHAVRKWKFSPFEVNGSAVRVSSTLTIPFSLAKRPNEPSEKQQKAAQELFPMSDKCRSALKDNNVQDAIDFCAQAVELSYKAGDLTSSDQLMMTSAHELYGHALLAAGRLDEALNEENKAIEEAKFCLTERDQEYAIPFYWRAMVEKSRGEFDKSLSDFSVAEQTHRRAMANLPDMKRIYGHYLTIILRQHAALLDQLGQTADASKLRSEAASL
jgi:TonB family protein